MESTLEEQVITLDPKKVKLPLEASLTLELTATLTLGKCYGIEEKYYILMSGRLIDSRVMYGDNDLERIKQVYKMILEDIKKGNYEIKTEIKLEVFPETQLWADIP